MRRLLAPHLPSGFGGERQIPLDNVGRDLFVAFPGRVLDQDPAVFPGQLVAVCDRLIVIEFGDSGVGAAGLLDRAAPGFDGALRHKDVRLAAEKLRGPGNALAVIAVRGGHEGDLRAALTDIRFLKVRKNRAARIQGEPLAEDPEHGIASAEPLEGLQAEAAGFVLHEDRTHSVPRGGGGQAVKGRLPVARQRPVKAQGVLRRLFGEGEADLVKNGFPPHKAEIRRLVFSHRFTLSRRSDAAGDRPQTGRADCSTHRAF